MIKTWTSILVQCNIWCQLFKGLNECLRSSRGVHARGPRAPEWIISHIIKDLHKESVTTKQPHQRAWIKVNQALWARLVKRSDTQVSGSHLNVGAWTCWPVIDLKRVSVLFCSGGLWVHPVSWARLSSTANVTSGLFTSQNLSWQKLTDDMLFLLDIRGPPRGEAASIIQIRGVVFFLGGKGNFEVLETWGEEFTFYFWKMHMVTLL